jgi:hypothetical protein
MLSGISSISIESSTSIESSPGSGCVSGTVNRSGSSSKCIAAFPLAAVFLGSFFATGSLAAGLRPLFTGAGASSITSSWSLRVFAGRPFFAGLAGAATSSSSKSSTSSVSLPWASLSSVSALRPALAGAFFATAALLFLTPDALPPLTRRVADFALAVALVAGAIDLACADFPRASGAGALFSALDSGVGSALSSSCVRSSSEAESTVKEMFATLLRGAMVSNKLRALCWCWCCVVAWLEMRRKLEVGCVNNTARARVPKWSTRSCHQLHAKKDPPRRSSYQALKCN